LKGLGGKVGIGIDAVFVGTLPLLTSMAAVVDVAVYGVTGVSDKAARSGSSRDFFLFFIDLWGLPGPGEIDELRLLEPVAFLEGLLAFEAELPMSAIQICSILPFVGQSD